MTKREILDCVHDAPSQEKLERALATVKHGMVYTVELDEQSFNPCSRLMMAFVED